MKCGCYLPSTLLQCDQFLITNSVLDAVERWCEPCRYRPDCRDDRPPWPSACGMALELVIEAELIYCRHVADLNSQTALNESVVALCNGVARAPSYCWPDANR